MSKTSMPLPIIGNSTVIKVAGIENVPAKIDTGATRSSIWASNIDMLPDGTLEFTLFAPQSPYYTGERLHTKHYTVLPVRNSTGQESLRYIVQLSVVLKKRRIKVSFSLADRSRNEFPVLIGRRTLKNKFYVDVSQLEVPYKKRRLESQLEKELRQNPQLFHQKYIHKH